MKFGIRVWITLTLMVSMIAACGHLQPPSVKELSPISMPEFNLPSSSPYKDTMKKPLPSTQKKPQSSPQATTLVSNLQSRLPSKPEASSYNQPFVSKSSDAQHNRKRKTSKPLDNPPAKHSKSTGKVAYLTFDDGPTANTSEILTILKRNDVKATFFVIGKPSPEGRALYRRIVKEGHMLGNHTYSHRYKSIYRSPEAFQRDFDKLDKLLLETVGFKPTIMRFPGGSNNHVSWKAGGPHVMLHISNHMAAQGYQYFDWNVSAGDGGPPYPSKEAIVNKVLKESQNRSSIIVLMHDGLGQQTTVQALPEIITRLKSEGYQFKTLTKNAYTVHLLKD